MKMMMGQEFLRMKDMPSQVRLPKDLQGNEVIIAVLISEKLTNFRRLSTTGGTCDG